MCDGWSSPALEDQPCRPWRPALDREHRRRSRTARQLGQRRVQAHRPGHRPALGCRRRSGWITLDAEIRQVVFFDTPDLALDRAGVVVRARRVPRGGDVVVKLRPVEPSDAAEEAPPDARVRRRGGRDARQARLLGHAQGPGRQRGDQPRDRGQALAGEAPHPDPAGAVRQSTRRSSIDLDSLVPLGPINLAQAQVLAARLSSAGWWRRCGSSRTARASSSSRPSACRPRPGPTLATTRALLTDTGVQLSGQQQTKTRAALQFFSKLAVAQAAKAAEEAAARARADRAPPGCAGSAGATGAARRPLPRPPARRLRSAGWSRPCRARTRRCRRSRPARASSRSRRASARAAGRRTGTRRAAGRWSRMASAAT